MDTETMNLKSIGMDLKATLWDILELQHQKGGFHSLQETLGCEFQKDTGARGFWYYCYDGTPFLSYHPETQRWIEPQSSDHYLASEVKKTWNIDGDKHKDYSHRVQGDICIKLQRFLDSRSDFMERTVSPAVNVTSSEAVEGNVTLTCRATGFYPREISLTWLQDGKPLHVDSQDCGCILSDGNGNYKTWVSTRLPKGEEQRYSCYVEHSGQNSTHPVSHGVTLVQEVSRPTLIQERSRIISCFVLGAAVTAVTTGFLFWCHKKQKSSDVESPANGPNSAGTDAHRGPKWHAVKTTEKTERPTRVGAYIDLGPEEPDGARPPPAIAMTELTERSLTGNTRIKRGAS